MKTTDDKIITLIYLLVFKLGRGGGGGRVQKNFKTEHDNKNKNYYKPQVPPRTCQDPRATVFEVTCRVISVAPLPRY